MTTLQKSVLALVAAIIVVGAYGGYKYLLTPTPEVVTAGASPSGSTFNTAKVASISIAPAAPGTNATSSSIQNTDSNDRVIISEEGECEGLGTAKTAYTGAGLLALTASMATSSTAAPATNSNPNIVGSTAMTIATSTGNFAVASSTASNGATSPGSTLVNNIWAAGSYLTITLNATTTGQCNLGVRYIAS